MSEHPRLEHAAPPSFALVNLRHAGGDEATDRLAAAINASGHSYVTASTIDERSYIRVSIGQTWTTAAHVDRLWATIEENA